MTRGAFLPGWEGSRGDPTVAPDGGDDDDNDGDEGSTSPLRRGWSREFPRPTPFFPFGEGFTPPPTPSPGPGRGRSRVVGASKMAQDGSKSASESPR